MLTPLQFAQVAAAAWLPGSPSGSVFTCTTASHSFSMGTCYTFAASFRVGAVCYKGRAACPFQAIAEALAQVATAGAFERGQYSAAVTRLQHQEQAFSNAPAHA